MQSLGNYHLPTIQTLFNTDWRNKDINYAMKGLKQNPALFTAVAVETLRKEIDASEQENPNACYALGILYLYGTDAIQKDTNMALDLLKKSDTPEANYALGILYLKGWAGVSQDTDLGIDLMKRSATQGSSLSNVTLGLIYWLGAEGQAKDSQHADHYLTPIMTEGPDKLLEVFKHLSPKIKSESINYSIKTGYLKNAKTWLLYAGKDVDIDKVDLYRRLGNKYWKLTPESPKKTTDRPLNKQDMADVENNCRKKAIEIWEKKMKPGINQPLSEKIAEALSLLGHAIYSQARHRRGGAEAAHRLAVNYWHEAAESGSMLGQYYLGLAYCSGKGVKKDLQIGKEWLQKAAKTDFLPAKLMLNYLENKTPLAVKEIQYDDSLNLPRKEESHCIKANKPLYKKTISWFKKYSPALLIATITAVALATIIGGLTAFTVFLPHIALPIGMFVGVTVVPPLIFLVKVLNLMA